MLSTGDADESSATGDGSGHHRRAARRAPAPRRRSCSRTRRCSARSSGSARSAASAGRSRSGCTRSSARSSSAASAGARSPARPSTRFAMSSCATSRTGRSRGRRGQRSIARRPSGSSRSAGPEDHAEMLAHHYLPRSSSPGRRAEMSRRRRAGAHCPERSGRPRARAACSSAAAARFYRRALELSPD